MDRFIRRIVGFAVKPGAVDSPAICGMFNRAVAGELTLPRHLSTDHDPLFQFHRWKANLRILDRCVKNLYLTHLYRIRSLSD